MAPIAHQPGPGGYQGSSTSQLVGSVVLGCTAAPAVPPARDLDFFISTGDLTPAGPLASAPGAEAHAGIAFQSPYSRYNKRQRRKAVDPPDARTFTQGLVNALLRVAQMVIALSLTPTPSPILPFVVRDIVTVYWVKLDDLRATKYLPQRTLAGRPLD